MILMIFACIHELAHLLIGLILGFRPDTFKIKPIGFSISFYHGAEDYIKKIGKGNVNNLKNIMVYLAGPITNIFVAIIVYFLRGDVLVREEIIYSNLIIAFVNMLPIFPLDGGRIIENFFEICLGSEKANMYIYRLSWITMIMILAVSSIMVLKVKNFALLTMLLYILGIQIKMTAQKEKNKFL